MMVGGAARAGNYFGRCLRKVVAGCFIVADDETPTPISEEETVKSLLLTSAALLLLALPAVAKDVRPASEAEFAKLIPGCWSEDIKKPQDGDTFVQFTSVCFKADGAVDFSQFASLMHAGGGEGMDGFSRYRFKSEKLVIDDWVYYGKLVCDAVIVPSKFLELSNCSSGESTLTSKAVDYRFKASRR